MRPCERTAREACRQGVDGLFATLAVVMAEGGGACLLTVAVRLLGGTETAYHVLECACSALGSYSLSSGRLMRPCERLRRVCCRT